MKRIRLVFCVLAVASVGFSELTYDYTGKGGTFDGTNLVEVALNDSGIDFVMTVVGAGGDLNSNSGDFGIGDDLIDGQSEIITLSFDTAIDFISIEFGGVGASVADGVRLTIGSQSPIDLHTGVAGFEGTPDLYTPASVIRVNAGEFITLTGSSGTSSFDLERMTIIAIPEPATFALIGIGGVLALIARRRFF